ncbi:AAA family ATPase [Eisenbergiella tayi]|uniref:Divergent AAA domain protein n=1 Tax=Eisenbergiella tayi TaxID=1432052 RepID=A0A1E3ARP6_9FIRM|nr:ATP-binding protein [Eisenbergiella tayi]ODM11385.1 Divergent AAA domain protein [Eisenbergiella tayi]OIZ59157.1 AAA family ATPase [Eisenbergiella tayi]
MEWKELLGEATEYDKKQAVERKKPKSWLKSISAFANTSGGTLIFGISNEEEVVGLSDIRSDSEYISQKLKERIYPFPEVVMKLYKTEDEKNLLFVHVPEGAETPYYYSADGVTEAYIRIGNESVIAGPTELKRLVMRGKNTSYDFQISSYQFDDYSFTKLRERYKVWTGKSLPDNAYESFGIKDSNGHLTNAGALIADESPIWWSRIFCTRWNGLDKSGGLLDALDHTEFNGSLITLLNEGFAFVKRNMKTMWKKQPLGRLEFPDYSEDSVFEALVNALIHRDYLVNGSEVHIDIFDDRLEIYSPGGMPDGSFIQDLDINTVSSVRRNPLLADIFGRLGYMERQGSGLGKICRAYEHQDNYVPEKEPIFTSTRSSFFVILKNLNYGLEFIEQEQTMPDGTNNGTNVGTIGTDNQKSDPDRLEKIILRILNEEPEITTRELAEQSKVSVRTVKRIISDLKNRNLLSREGSSRKGKWVVIHK